MVLRFVAFDHMDIIYLCIYETNRILSKNLMNYILMIVFTYKLVLFRCTLDTAIGPIIHTRIDTVFAPKLF